MSENIDSYPWHLTMPLPQPVNIPNNTPSVCNQNRVETNLDSNVHASPRERFGKNERVNYTKDTKIRECTVKEVHRDDAPNWYYTIVFDNGDEKQTIEKYLEHIRLRTSKKKTTKNNRNKQSILPPHRYPIRN